MNMPGFTAALSLRQGYGYPLAVGDPAEADSAVQPAQQGMLVSRELGTTFGLRSAFYRAIAMWLAGREPCDMRTYRQTWCDCLARSHCDPFGACRPNVADPTCRPVVFDCIGRAQAASGCTNLV